MMRKEDLKKHCKEEKNVSATEHFWYSSVLITLLYFSNLSAQIPVNGFCRYREFQSKSGYTDIYAVDYNSDGYRDLLIYNPSLNKYSTITSDQKSNLVSYSEKYSSAFLTDIKPFGNEPSGRKFLITSRKTREVLLANFSKSGTMSLSGRVKLGGYPANVDVADIDGDGKPDGLVSGNSLDGLYIVKERRGVLSETKIENKKIFSWACFIDLNYDSYSDIAAIDPVSNSIILFYNNEAGNFTESRSIGLNSEVSAFRQSDINSDGFSDLVFVRNNHIEAFLGDSVSSFQKIFSIDTPVNPDKLVIVDFNGDGFNDIAYLNLIEGELYISFSKNGDQFYPPILYLKKNGLVSITAYIDRAGKKIAAVSSDGKVYQINSIGINDASFSIAAGERPSAVGTFDYMNDRFKDLCYVDEGGPYLKLLLSERSNLFRTYYSIPISKSYSKIIVDESNPKTKTFYLYSNGDQIIEIVRMNFDAQKFSKLVLYTENPIEDFKLSTDRLKDWQTLSVVCKKEGNLFIQIQELRNFQKASSVIYPVASGAERAWLAFSVYKDVYSYSHSGNKVELSKSVFNKRVVEKTTLLNLTVEPKDNFSYELISINETVNRFKPVISLVTLNNSSSLYYFSNKAIKKYPLQYDFSAGTVPSYSIDENNDQLTIYYADSRKNRLRSVTISGSDNKLIGKELIESKKINNYLATALNKGKTFLIYSNSFQNTLSFEKL